MTQINHPDYYKKGKIETIEFIKQALGEEGTVDFCIGNCLKYIARSKYKENQLDDLKKCQWYINYAVKLLDKEATHKSAKKKQYKYESSLYGRYRLVYKRGVLELVGRGDNMNYATSVCITNEDAEQFMSDAQEELQKKPTYKPMNVCRLFPGAPTFDRWLRVMHDEFSNYEEEQK